MVTNHERSTPYAPRSLLPNPWGSAGGLRDVGATGHDGDDLAATVVGAAMDRWSVLDGRRSAGGDRSQWRADAHAHATASAAGGGQPHRAAAALGARRRSGTRERSGRTATRQLPTSCGMAVSAGMVAVRQRLRRPLIGVARRCAGIAPLDHGISDYGGELIRRWRNSEFRMQNAECGCPGGFAQALSILRRCLPHSAFCILNSALGQRP